VEIFSDGRAERAADRGPGWIEVTFYPASVPVKVPGGSRPEAEFLKRASPWVQNRLLSLEGRDRRQVCGLTIGPVTPLASDSVDQIGAEIQAVLERPEFAFLREQALRPPAPAGRIEKGRAVRSGCGVP